MVANDEYGDAERLVGLLRNYARWVRISLRMLAADGSVPRVHDGSPEYPRLGGDGDVPLWQPNPLPPGWYEQEVAETAG